MAKPATSVTKAARRWQAAKDREAATRAALIETIAKAEADGLPERQIAPIVGVDRMTIRRWMGKHTSAQQRAARPRAGE